MKKKGYTKVEFNRCKKAVKWFGISAFICLIVGVVLVFIRKSILKSLEKPSSATFPTPNDLKSIAEILEFLSFFLICGGIGLLLMALILVPFIRKRPRAMEKSNASDT